MVSARPQVLRLGAALALALSCAGCLGRAGPETTGSIGPATAAQSEADWRAQAAALGKRFDANPGDAQVSIAYARALRELGQHVQAVAVLQQAAIRNPNALPVLAAYGKALADAGRLNEAASVLARAHVPERPDWRVLSAQGAVADQLGNHEAAQAYYRTALNIVPNEPSILSNLGLSYALSRHLSEGEATLRLAASQPGANQRVRQNLALVLGLSGKFAEAEQVLRRDLPPAEAAANLATMKRMLSQPNSWKALGQAGSNASKSAGASASQAAG